MSNHIAITTVALSTSGLEVGRVGHGLMSMTWKMPALDDETAFTAIKAGLDLVKPGQKIFLNSAEFYGIDPPEANLLLLKRFFEKYPNYRERAFISVKGGLAGGPIPAGLTPISSASNLRRSVLAIAQALGSKIDLFEPARLDGKTEIEEVMKTLKGFQDEGLIEYIGLSEVNADTLRKAEKVAHVTAVEIEVSPWTYEKATKDVITTAKELGISVIGYSPLGRGFLTGKLKLEDLPAHDFKRMLPRFQADAAASNQKIVDKLAIIAKKKGVTNAQLCIGWQTTLGDHVIPLPGSSNVSRTLENFAGGNITFTPEEKAELDAEIEEFQEIVSGHRYPEMGQKHLML